MDEKLAGFIGLCRKAGKTAIGMDAVSDAAKRGQAALVLTASDAGKSTLREAAFLGGKARFGQAGLPGSKEELGRSLGVKSCAILALLDENFASAVLKKLGDAEASQQTE